MSNPTLEFQKRPRRQLTPEKLKELQESANKFRKEAGQEPLEDDGYVSPSKRIKVPKDKKKS